MKYLIAGFGSIGRRHFRNLLSLGERDILIYHTHHSTLPEDELAGFPIETDLRASAGIHARRSYHIQPNCPPPGCSHSRLHIVAAIC